MRSNQRFRSGVLALVVGAMVAPAVSQAQRPPRSSDSSPSSPPTSSSSSGSYGSGASYSSGSSSSSSSSSSSYDSGSSSSYSSGSSSSSYGSGSSYSSGSSPRASRPPRSSETAMERERPGYVREVPARSSSSSSSSSTVTDSSSTSSGSSASGAASSGSSASTPVGHPARTGSSGTSSSMPVATAPAARPPRDATGIVPSNPNAVADARVERNRQRTLRPEPTAATTAAPRTVRAPSREAAIRQRVYRTPENTTRNLRGQYVSPTHERRLEVVIAQAAQVRTHRGSRKFVERREKAYRQSARPDAYRRFGEHRELWRARPARWSRWYDYGFYGGYYWDLGEFFEVEEHFENPVLGYYFDGEWYEDIYEKWFEIKDGKRILYKRPFAYPGVPLPTEALVELLMSVSAMDLSTQEKFRYGFERIIQLLQSDLMKIYGQDFNLGKNDLVISHFRLLDGKGVVLEGTVGKGLAQYPFKAVMEFSRPLAAEVFVATDENPEARPELIKKLNEVNSTIDKLINSDLEDEFLVPLEYGLEQPK